jgi:hypothetical protein
MSAWALQADKIAVGVFDDCVARTEEGIERLLARGVSSGFELCVKSVDGLAVGQIDVEHRRTASAAVVTLVPHPHEVGLSASRTPAASAISAASPMRRNCQPNRLENVLLRSRSETTRFTWRSG